MNKKIKVKTQAEFDAVVKAGNVAVCICGHFKARGNSSVKACGNSSVEAWGDSSVKAWGNSSVEAWGDSSVEAWENSSVKALENSSVKARENSSVKAWGNSSVKAWGNSSVEARENSSVEAWGNSSVEAWGNVFIRLFSCLKISAGSHVVIMDHGDNKKQISGGRVIKAFKSKTVLQWCSHWGVKIENKVAILFKGVDEKYLSRNKGDYTPGTCPIAPDWDGGKEECGGGLHFSPHPKMTHQFCDPQKYVACPVALKDIAVHPDGEYPEKVKAKGCCAAVWEVNEDGEKITQAPADAGKGEK